MAYSARILLDSISPSKCRLTTMELTYPRFVHAEFMTHRMISRNSASSRAIPIDKMIERVMNDPVLPVWWGKNQPGMQANEEIFGNDRRAAEDLIILMRNRSVDCVKRLQQFGLHKQIANRYLEPWMWITVIATATEWDNFFHLRTDSDAQPEIRKIAEMACFEYIHSKPREMKYGSWHLPLIQKDELSDAESLVEPVIYKDVVPGFERDFDLRHISVARCARVSYLTHDGRRSLEEDMKLYERLIHADDNGKPGHWSPLEHVAMALSHPIKSGNFRGWMQFRKHFYARENCTNFDYTKWATTKGIATV